MFIQDPGAPAPLLFEKPQPSVLASYSLAESCSTQVKSALKIVRKPLTSSGSYSEE